MPAPDYAVEIAAIEAAIATGELRVEMDGEMVIYKSSTEQLKALVYFQDRAAANAAAASSRGKFGFSAPAYSRD